MKRIVLAAAAAALALLPLRAEDKPAKPASPGEVKSNRADEIKAIKDEFAAKRQEWTKTVQAAKTAEERQAAIRNQPAPGPFAERARKLFAADAKDEAGFEAILFVVTNVGPDAAALKAITEHHVANPKLETIVPRLANPRTFSPAVEKLLTAALEKNPSKKVKGFAAYGLGSALMGNPARAKDAEKYLVMVEKEFSDVEIGRGRDGKPITLGSRVSGQLFEIRHLALGKTAPEVVSKDLDDKKTALADLKGKVVVMDFWATWCPPCKAMIPHSRELVEKMKGRPFALVSISSDAQKETLTKFLETEKMPWTHWWEGNTDASLHRKWNVSGIPTMYIVDAKGVIRYKQVGFTKELMEKMEQKVEELVKEAEAK